MTRAARTALDFPSNHPRLPRIDTLTPILSAPGGGKGRCEVAELRRSQTAPKPSRRPGRLTRLLDLIRPGPSLPLLDLEALNDHWLRDLGIADGRPPPRRRSFRD